MGGAAIAAIKSLPPPENRIACHLIASGPQSKRRKRGELVVSTMRCNTAPG